MILKLFVALRFGEPSSVTLTRNKFVVSACATNGRKLNTPLEAPSVAFVGPDTSTNVSVWNGTSGSVATLVSVTVTPTFTVWSETGEIDGALFPTERVAVPLVTEPALLD